MIVSPYKNSTTLQPAAPFYLQAVFLRKVKIMMKYFCDRCGVEMNQKKYREGYRLPDPNPKYNAWDDDESVDPSAE